MPNPHTEYLEAKHSLADLKQFCRENKIRGFSGLNKADLKNLIYKHGEAMTEANEKTEKHDADMDAFFTDAEAKVGLSKSKKADVKQDKKEIKDFLDKADAMEKKTRKKKIMIKVKSKKSKM